LLNNSTLIAGRAAEGRTRDCHGDLRADAIVIGEDGEICVMDCIEFNDRIRYGDVAGDIAFLAMDLDFRGRPDLADEVISAYLGEADDETLPCVLNFYRCYRAYVRGKVESMQLDESEVPEEQRRASQARAGAYFDLACSYAATAYPRAAVMTVGLSGSGKSYLAGGIAGRLGAALLSSDTTRRRLLGMRPGEHAHVPYGQGIYAEQTRERVYGEMHARAADHLRQGRSVILDATYASRTDRDAAQRVARTAGVPLVAVEVVADEAAVRSHLARRAGEPQAASDARWAIYLAQRSRFEPPDELLAGARVRVDGARPLRENVERVLGVVRRLSG
jgi:predicted kinase